MAACGARRDASASAPRSQPAAAQFRLAQRRGEDFFVVAQLRRGPLEDAPGITDRRGAAPCIGRSPGMSASGTMCLRTSMAPSASMDAVDDFYHILRTHALAAAQYLNASGTGS